MSDHSAGQQNATVENVINAIPGFQSQRPGDDRKPIISTPVVNPTHQSLTLSSSFLFLLLVANAIFYRRLD